MRIAVHSDLHTEISPCRLQGLDEAELLVLAGDIGDLASLPAFFAQLRADAPDLPVLYVLGNHDRYGMRRAEGVAAHRALAAEFAIRLLDDEAVIFADVLFCGTTLWTDFALGGDAAASMQWAGETLPDFVHILDDAGAPLTPEEMQQWFYQAKDFLHRALAYEEVRARVVISHFLPSRRVVAAEHGADAQALLRSAYWASEVADVYAQCDVWIYGHSHSNVQASAGNTRFVSNQRGARRKAADYQRDFVLAV